MMRKLKKRKAVEYYIKSTGVLGRKRNLYSVPSAEFKIDAKLGSIDHKQ